MWLRSNERLVKIAILLLGALFLTFLYLYLTYSSIPVPVPDNATTVNVASTTIAVQLDPNSIKSVKSLAKDLGLPIDLNWNDSVLCVDNQNVDHVTTLIKGKIYSRISYVPPKARYPGFNSQNNMENTMQVGAMDVILESADYSREIYLLPGEWKCLAVSNEMLLSGKLMVIYRHAVQIRTPIGDSATTSIYDIDVQDWVDSSDSQITLGLPNRAVVIAYIICFFAWFGFIQLLLALIRFVQNPVSFAE